jgi:hypothetical protein
MESQLETEIDETWINENRKYSDYYKEDITEIKIYFFYINKEEVLEKIEETTLILNEKNKISKEELTEEIYKYRKYYQLFHILSYNIDLDPAHLVQYINDVHHDDYLKEIPHLQTIQLKPSVHLLNDINCVYILFKESPTNHYAKTKKVTFQLTNKKKTQKQYKEKKKILIYGDR